MLATTDHWARTVEPGWDVKRVAEAWATLMARLGYDRYGAQGTDGDHGRELRALERTSR